MPSEANRIDFSVLGLPSAGLAADTVVGTTDSRSERTVTRTENRKRALRVTGHLHDCGHKGGAAGRVRRSNR